MKVYITIDIEAHRSIQEIQGAGQDSLGTLLTVLRETACRATCFVDVCEVSRWGFDFMKATCLRIAADGHRVELHVHPHHTTGDNGRWLLSEYTCEEQIGILTKAVADFQELTGRKPLAFRAGGFGANEDTLTILRNLGIEVDSSFLWRRPGCHLRPQNKAEASEYLGLIEIPLTPVVLMGTKSISRRVSSLDFNWIPLFALKRLYIELERSGSKTAVFLLHSSTMYVRTGKKRYWYRRRNERKLRALIQFLQDRQAQFHVMGSRDLADVSGNAMEFTPEPVVLNGLLIQYVVLLYQAAVGAGISKKLFGFLIANILGFLAAIILMLCLIVRCF